MKIINRAIVSDASGW